MKRCWSETQEYGELGIIESVSLRNFMCHDNLSFEFDPHMNFIVGRNGSGKSAVLTAIILALGGKSGATGRFSNIKGFVKTGKSSATVSVTLKNMGPDAYKPEEYGKRIIVERHLSSEGVSHYKLKSQAGRIISNSKEELTNILNIMDIQIENPITVLTQVISKNFLLSLKPDKLFQLFYRGTGLAKVHDDYNMSVRQKEEARMELENKKSILPEMERDIKKLKSMLQKSSKITELKKELLWATVIEFEKRRDETKSALESVQKSYSDLNKKLKACETELANIQQNLAAAIIEKKDSSEKMEAIRRDVQELTQKRYSVSSEIRQIQGTYSSHEREVKKLSSEIASLENIINDIQTKNQNDLNDDKLRYEETQNNLKNNVYNITAKINLKEITKNSHRDLAGELQQKIDYCHAEIQEMNYEQNNIMRERQQLIDGLVNRINVFGPEMANVLREIKNAVKSRLFKVEPKGPIGLYINVKKPEWNFAVQECLKSGFLMNFICDNHADADVLTRIFNKCFQRNRPSIITSKFVSEVYDVSAHKTVCEHPTVLDMLNIDDPVIANCLIDHKQIENIILIAEQNEACRIMLHNPPQKCRFAYTMNGDQYCSSPYRSYSCRNKNQILMLKCVNEEDIRKKDGDLKQLDCSKSVKLKELENLTLQLREKEQEIYRIDNDITDMKIKRKSLYMKLKEEENSYEEPKDINCLQTDLEELQKEKMCHEEQLASSKDVLNTKTEELNSLDKNMKEFQRILQIESRGFHALSEKFDEHENRKEKFSTAINKIKNQLRVIEPVLEQKRKDLSDEEATVTLATSKAEESGERIETRRSPDAIRQILKETEQFIRKQRNCDQTTLLKEYEEKIQALNKSKSELVKHEKVNARLSQMLTLRFQEFRKTCNNTSVSLTCCFTLLLKENNFTGAPDINFNEKTLNIMAQPEKTGSKHKEATNLAQLSGGERSYVTIAFLLSLWDRINMPFRILDEYDVFMDSNNRHLSINLLVNTARANKKIQYIFLSPLELPDIEDSDHVKVHKMPSPRH